MWYLSPFLVCLLQPVPKCKKIVVVRGWLGVLGLVVCYIPSTFGTVVVDKYISTKFLKTSLSVTLINTCFVQTKRNKSWTCSFCISLGVPFTAKVEKKQEWSYLKTQSLTASVQPCAWTWEIARSQGGEDMPVFILPWIGVPHLTSILYCTQHFLFVVRLDTWGEGGAVRWSQRWANIFRPGI